MVAQDGLLPTPMLDQRKMISPSSKMYATSGGAPAGSTKVLQTENPYFDASEQIPKNTKQLRAQKLIPKRQKVLKAVQQPINLPRPKSPYVSRLKKI